MAKSYFHVDDLMQAVNAACASVPNPDGWVYAVHWKGQRYAAWKIGYTRRDLDRRMDELQAQYGPGLQADTRVKIDCRGDPQYLEDVLHTIFENLPCTVMGHDREWFSLGLRNEVAWLRGLRGIDCSQLRELIRNVPRRIV